MPISFFCNRETTAIPKCQPGFMNGIIYPLWTLMVEILPDMKVFLDESKANCVKWEQYVETEEDKKSYVKQK